MTEQQSGHKGKVALVTGAASGIGQAIAAAFGAAGAAVLAADIDMAGAEAIAAEIVRGGGLALAKRVDVAKEADVEAMVSAAVSAHGGLDYAVNCAGIEGEAPRIDENTEAVFDRLMSVNVKGVFLCMKHEIQQMRSQGRGAIVNIASVNSFRSLPGITLYTTTKHAVIGLTRNAAVDCAAASIRINAICPGAIETPMLNASLDRIPLPRAELIAQFSLIGRFGLPVEVAKAALWLCSDDASFIHGHALAVDGGYLAR